MWPFNKDKPKAKRARLEKRSMGFASSLIDNIRSDWASSSMSADQLLAKNLKTLRARSRDQYYNNDYAKRFVSMVKVNVVGENGVSIQSKAVDAAQKPDKPAQKAIEAAFKSWSTTPKHCDIKGRLNLKEIEDLIMASVAIDGEAFVQVITGGEHGLKLKIIDAEKVDITYFEKAANGNFIKFGIEYDMSGKAVAYHINQEDNNVSPLGADYRTINRTRVDAEEIIHIFVSELPDQRRGIPWMSTALTHLKMLAGYEEAALVAARIGAAKMGFFTSGTGDEYTGEEVGGEFTTSAEAGTFEQLPDGLKFESFNPDYPTGEFATFSKQILRSVASAFNVSYNTMANDLEGVNFSSMRHGTVEEREAWKGMQSMLINQFVRPLFETFISRQHKLQTIVIYSASAQPIPLKRNVNNYLPAVYQGRRWDFFDPLKDIKAHQEAYKLKVTSISSIIRDRGKDPEEVFEEIAREKELMNELGISPQEVGFFMGEINEQPEE